MSKDLDSETMEQYMKFLEFQKFRQLDQKINKENCVPVQTCITSSSNSLKDQKNKDRKVSNIKPAGLSSDDENNFQVTVLKPIMPPQP